MMKCSACFRQVQRQHSNGWVVRHFVEALHRDHFGDITVEALNGAKERAHRAILADRLPALRDDLLNNRPDMVRSLLAYERTYTLSQCIVLGPLMSSTSALQLYVLPAREQREVSSQSGKPTCTQGGGCSFYLNSHLAVQVSIAKATTGKILTVFLSFLYTGEYDGKSIETEDDLRQLLQLAEHHNMTRCAALTCLFP